MKNLKFSYYFIKKATDNVKAELLCNVKKIG